MVEKADYFLISFFRRWSMPAARIALFIIFFWFGILKVFSLSPANPLVIALAERTLPFINPYAFVLSFGVLEMIIGIIFLIPFAERAALALLALHMGTTFLPLIFLPAVTWSGFLVPTLEGQYIIKNLVIIALAMGIAANLKPFWNSKQDPLK